MVEIKRNIEVEKVEKLGKKPSVVKRENKIKELIEKQNNARNYKQWLTLKLRQATIEKNEDFRQIVLLFSNTYRRFETIEKIKINSWKGKSGIIDLIYEPDKIIAIKMQKKGPDKTPEEVRIEITKEQLNATIQSLNMLKDNQPIPTERLCMIYSKLLELNHSGWKRGDNPFFTDRTEHNRLTVILNILETRGLIKYGRDGNTTIISKKMEIEEFFE